MHIGVHPTAHVVHEQSLHAWGLGHTGWVYGYTGIRYGYTGIRYRYTGKRMGVEQGAMGAGAAG